MSTPRPIAAYCKHGNSYCILCFAESKEGVAAPLEPNAEQVFNFCADPDNPPYLCIQKINEHAAAVSKNLQQELAELKLTHEFAELHIAELEKEIAALRETKL